MMDAGYGSSSRFYERAAPKLGVAPAAYRRGDAAVRIRYTIVDSALGRLLIAATTRGVCSIAMASNDRSLTQALFDEYPSAVITRDDDRLCSWAREVMRRVAGREPGLDLPLDIRATAFQWQVWQALTKIPRGETRSYSQIAAALGRPRAVRAVARACATNPAAVVIPCHRVVPAGGSVGGYRWGSARKKRLLDAEHER
jgi:AraC family transcriptional regulator of adaptative response/methylated-DNA-[protein]-cysteine methyltransferase